MWWMEGGDALGLGHGGFQGKCVRERCILNKKWGTEIAFRTPSVEQAASPTRSIVLIVGFMLPGHMLLYMQRHYRVMAKSQAIATLTGSQ